MPAKRLILSLCDFTGNWTKYYRESKYPRYRVELIDLKHGQDVRLLQIPKESVYGILAAPPCTVFANSGARWKRTDEEMIEGLSIVDACLRIVHACKPAFWALENPVGKLQRYIGKPRMYFDPCDYGDPYTKRTCLWGEFNCPIRTRVEPHLGSIIHTKHNSHTERTYGSRSATPLGFAKAFFLANQ
jgi:hypothetical protein